MVQPFTRTKYLNKFTSVLIWIKMCRWEWNFWMTQFTATILHWLLVLTIMKCIPILGFGIPDYYIDILGTFKILYLFRSLGIIDTLLTKYVLTCTSTLIARRGWKMGQKWKWMPEVCGFIFYKICDIRYLVHPLSACGIWTWKDQECRCMETCRNQVTNDTTSCWGFLTFLS